MLRMTLALIALSLPSTTHRNHPCCAEEALRSLRELALELKNDSEAVRRKAVVDLAARDERPAWEHVIAALGDPAGRVADEAQSCLTRLEDPALVRKLLRRDGLASKDEGRRQRVAELLGRREAALDGEAALRAIDGRQVSSARLLLWSLERLDQRGLLEGNRRNMARALKPLMARRRDPLLQADALILKARFEPEPVAVAELQEAARSKLPALRRAALDGLARLNTSACRQAARRLLEDPDVRVRRAAIATLATHGDRLGFESLIEQLEQEPSPRVREQVLSVLRAWTGLKHRADPRPWRDALADLSPDWRPLGVASGSMAHSRSSAARTTVPLSDLAVTGGSITFLVDFSGSTWSTAIDEAAGDTRTRKQLLDLRMAELLGRLSPEMTFNVVPYTNVPHPWKEKRVRATPRAIREAQAFFEGCRESGQGNVFDAIQCALREPGLETLVILTDGAPTGGRHWDLELMVEMWKQENRHRGVVFDVVLVDAPRRLVRHWENLALASHGRCLEVELTQP